MGFPELYSKRGKAPTIRYEIPRKVRTRLLLLIEAEFGEPSALVLNEVQARLTLRYGDFTPCNRRDIHPAAHHFMVCDDEQALDFIEAVFTSSRDMYIAGLLVNDFNRVFREEGIGYELTPLSQRTIKDGVSFYGHAVDRLDTTYPIIRKRGDTLQEEGMTQCLDLLTNPDFKIANDQFLKAHQHYRAGEWDQTIAYCGSAFESTLKAVLGKRGIPFDEKAAAQVLVQECVKAGIFPQTYQNSLTGIANVRNAMSDATHGRTRTGQIVPEEKNAEHLLYSTAANIAFVAKCV
jgi:hypothetical protein